MVNELADKLNAENSPETLNHQSEMQLECDNMTRKDIEASYFDKNSKKSLPLHETGELTVSYGEMFNKEVVLDASDQISPRNFLSDLKQNTQENESSETVDRKPSTAQDIGETVSDTAEVLKPEKCDDCFERQTNNFMKSLKCGNNFDINSVSGLNIGTVHYLNEDAKCISFDNVKTVLESADCNGNENSSSNENCKDIAVMNVIRHSKSISDIGSDIDVVCNLKHLNVAENHNVDDQVIENELGQDSRCEYITSNSTEGSKNFEKVESKGESTETHSVESSQNIEQVDLKCVKKEAHPNVSSPNFEKKDLKCVDKERHSDLSSRNFEKVDLKYETTESYSDSSNRTIEEVDFKCENNEAHSDVVSQNFENVDYECENAKAHSEEKGRNIEKVDMKCEDKEARSDVPYKTIENVELKCEDQEDVSSRNNEKVDLKCENKASHSDVSCQNIEKDDLKCKDKDVSTQNNEQVDLKCEDKEDLSTQNNEQVDLKCEDKEAHSDISSRNFESVANMENLDASQLSQDSNDSSNNLETEHNTSSSYSYRRALKYFQNLCDQHPQASVEKNNPNEIKNQPDKLIEFTTELKNLKRYFSNLQSDIVDLKREVLEIKALVENVLSTARTSDKKKTVNNGT